MAPRVCVALVNRLRQAPRRPVLRRAIRRVRDLLEVGPQDRLGRVGADTVLAVLLRPVQRTVREPDQLVPSGAVHGIRRDPGAHGHRADALDVQCRDALDDRACDSRRLPLVLPWQVHRELVSAEPEGLAALAQARRDLAEHEIADGVPEAVVDALEVVEVDEAEGKRRALVFGDDELALQAFVEAAVVAETSERVGQSESHRLHGLVGRALVERNREERADECERQHGLALPEDDQRQRCRGHERERRRRLRDVLLRDREEGAPGARREDGADQDEVDDPVVEEPADHDLRHEARDRVPVDVLDREPGHECREREHRAVVGDAQRRAPLEKMRDHRPSGGDDHARRPPEQDDRGDGEDEAEGDAAGADSLHRHGEPLRDGHAHEESGELSQILRRRRRSDVAIDGVGERRSARNDHGHDDRQYLGRNRSRSRSFRAGESRLVFSPHRYLPYEVRGRLPAEVAHQAAEIPKTNGNDAGEG